MASLLKILAITTAIATLTAAQSGSGQTTRYWDCCKPSCAWADKPGIASPVKSCDVSDNPLADANAQSGCAGGTAYMCSDQSPWAVNGNLAYGFAAVSTANSSCCSCYQLTFTNTVLQGKKMIVQATNTGSDVSATQFDLAIPGGGFGIFDGCSKEWNATSAVWGKQYGGSDTNTCSQFPSALQSGCGFRWDWMQGADNPDVDWEVVTCPAELVAKSGCSTTGYSTSPAPAMPEKLAVKRIPSSSNAAPVEESTSVVPAPAGESTSASAPAEEIPSSMAASSTASAAVPSISSSLSSTSPSKTNVSATAISASTSLSASDTAHSARPHWVPSKQRLNQEPDEQEDCDSW